MCTVTGARACVCVCTCARARSEHYHIYRYHIYRGVSIIIYKRKQVTNTPTDIYEKGQTLQTLQPLQTLQYSDPWWCCAT